MNPEIVKLRNNNDSYSVGIPQDIAKDLEENHFDRFLLSCYKGVITLTPTALLNTNKIGVALENIPKGKKGMAKLFTRSDKS